MSGTVSALASTTLAPTIQRDARLQNLTLELHERYLAVLQKEAESSSATRRAVAQRSLRALTYRPLDELTFASVGSWTVWATAPDGASIKDDWSRHRPRVAEYLAEVGEEPPIDVVFIALNWGAKEGLPTDNWANFHAGSRDYFLADAIGGTVHEEGGTSARPPLRRFQGVYITDFFKGLPTSDGGALRRIAGESFRELETLSGDLLERELALLGATTSTVLLPLGRTAREAQNPFCADRGFATLRDREGRVLRIDHYSYVQPHARYYAQLARAHASLTLATGS